MMEFILRFRLPPHHQLSLPQSPVLHGEFSTSLSLLSVSAMPRIPRLPEWKKKVFDVLLKVSYEDAIRLLAIMHITDEITLEEFSCTKAVIDKLCILGILEDGKLHAVEAAKFRAVRDAYTSLIHKRSSSI